MSGLCGWLGVETGPDPSGIVHAMAEALPAPPHGSTAAVGLPPAALGARTARGAGGFVEARGVLAAWDGYPRWTDAALAAVARSNGPGAALLEAWRRHGPDLLDHLAGEVAVAVLEPARKRLLVAVDRFGVHGLCWAEVRGGVVFGSTADAVRAHPAVETSLSAQALYDYFYFVDRVPAPETIWQGIGKLVPGECLLAEAGRVTRRRWGRVAYDPDRTAGEAGLQKDLRRHLDTAVRRCIDGEDTHQVAAFLSGGLDSSTVAGLFAQAVDHPARAVTVAFEDQRWDESPYARLAASHFRMDHDIVTVTPAEVEAAFEAIATAYDEPFGNSSAVPAYLCARRARETGVELMLAGDGGDELFAGNARYLSDAVFQHYGRIPAALRRAVIEPAALRLSPDSRIMPLRKVARYVRKARLPTPVRVTGDTVFRDQPAAGILAREVVAAVDPKAPERLVQAIWDDAGSDHPLHRHLWLDLRLTLADSDLRKVSRMCELAGVRVRYPMLDDDVADFSGRVPPDLLCRGGRLRAFYKDAFRGFLPDAILAKQKHGFGLPYLDMLTAHAPLRAMACDTLADLKGAGLFDAGFLDGQIRALRAGDRAAVPLAWDLVTVGRWLVSRRHPPGRRPQPALGAAE
ncbi:asparagine synthetase B family protein [Caenispirillum bisanense]|uniref:asparagine synthase (glutamine-hydrolyzing) n=1 Tax=Caenispirillum bisanense TaxID=414052 RepID=A0A286G6Z0_9PROT|nr:asparagine synthase-related protein [Caenispirillum bisanense]SOD90889.1 asparagine synthase (glutamine-hydrolysing) [Caenispirillum bisanense]